MITKEEIARLATIHSDQGIVSVSIRIDPRLDYERGQPAMKFKGAYSRARREADEWSISVLEREHDRILSFLEGWEQRGRGLVIFASEPGRLWEVHELDINVPSYVVVEPTPEVRYLAQALDEAPQMAVLMLDGGDARLYLANQRETSEQSEHRETLPSRHAQGGWSQARFQRHVEFHHSHVLREMAEQVTALFYAKGFDRLVLVGVDEATNELAGLLYDPIRERVIGHLHADFKTENDPHILERAAALADNQERSDEVALVDQIVNFAAAGGKGTVGLEDTLLALFEGRADTIAVVDGLTSEGTVCHNCGYFTAASFKQCPVCNSGDVDALPDVVDHAIDYAYLKGVHVNIVFGPAADLLTSRGGIGALLRYAVATPG